MKTRMDQIGPEQGFRIRLPWQQVNYLPKHNYTKLFPGKFEEKSRSRNTVDAIVRE